MWSQGLSVLKTYIINNIFDIIKYSVYIAAQITEGSMALSRDFTIVGMVAVGVTPASGLTVKHVNDRDPTNAIGRLKNAFDPSRSIGFRPIVWHEPTGQKYVHSHVKPDGAGNAVALSATQQLFSNISAHRIANTTDIPVLVSVDGADTFGEGSGLKVATPGASGFTPFGGSR